MTPGEDRRLFAALARESGVPLTDGETDALFEGYELLRKLVADLGQLDDVGVEPAFTYSPEGIG